MKKTVADSVRYIDIYINQHGGYNVKKLPVVLAATTLAASIGAFAQPLPNDAAPFGVSVPNIKSGFQFNIEGAFLEPSNSDLDYGFVTASPDDNSYSNLLTVRPDTEFAWGVGVGYVFPDSGNDVQLNWTGFSHTHTDRFDLPAPSDNWRSYITSPFDHEFDEGNVDWNDDEVTASSSAKSRLSAVDLNVGQYINVGNRLQLRPFAGLRFASVESNLRNNYRDYDNENDNRHDKLEQDLFKSKFNGVGPLLGADANYQLGGGVGATAHLATALLVGKVKASSDFAYQAYFNDNDGDPINYDDPSDDETASLRSHDTTRVVPAFDAKLGLNYSYTFDCDSVVTLEGGYKVTQYIDAVDRLRAQEFDDEDPEEVTRTTSSLGFSGPYVKLSLKI